MTFWQSVQPLLQIRSLLFTFDEFCCLQMLLCYHVIKFVDSIIRPKLAWVDFESPNKHLKLLSMDKRVSRWNCWIASSWLAVWELWTGDSFCSELMLSNYVNRKIVSKSIIRPAIKLGRKSFMRDTILKLNNK